MVEEMKSTIRALCPPLVWDGLVAMRRKIAAAGQTRAADRQDLGLYWDEEMAQLLETWGEGSAWTEIELLMAARDGSVLDIACGTGDVMKRVEEVSNVEVHGCDISDALIGKALQRGLAAARLTICDATIMPYVDLQFNFSYSIGSLEHFTEAGISQTLAEAARVTKVASFHMVPTSKSGRDEGWIKTYQSMHNCSVAWWHQKFAQAFRKVRVVESRWNDNISVGKWFLCEK